ncbi:DprA-like DNA processing chain A [Microbacterium phage SadLad]|nr:DprA-like DNA processing chain A [Microbacterium phage SadLad]
MAQRFPRVMVTGHRAQKIPAESHDWVKLELERLAIKLRDQHGTQIGVSGMALGADIWWAQAVKYAWLDLWAFLPFPQQADRWAPADVALWNEMRSRAAYEVVTAPEYSVGALFQRNEDMLENSDLVIAVWDPTVTSGGTYATVQSAVRRGLPIVHMHPHPLAQTTTFVAPGRMPS